MTEALEPAGWTACGTRCQCMCHRNPDVRHSMACCSSEKRDTPMTKSILSEQREADEALCDRLADMSYLMAMALTGERATDFVAIDWAAHRIHALSEALQEACHERDGLLVPQWQPIETAPKDGTKFLAWGFMHDDGGMYHDNGNSFMNERPWIGCVQWTDQGSFFSPTFGGYLDGLIEWRPTPPGEK